MTARWVALAEALEALYVGQVVDRRGPAVVEAELVEEQDPVEFLLGLADSPPRSAAARRCPKAEA